MRRILLVATIATLLIAALEAIAFAPRHPGPLPPRFASAHPIVAAELVASGAEIALVYGTKAQSGACDPTPKGDAVCGFVHTLRLNTWIDFLFIAAYGSMFFFLGLSMRDRLGLAIAVLAPLAALADVTENIGMFRAMAEPASDALAWSIRTPSLIKWTLLGVIWVALVRRYLVPETWRAGWSIWRLAELAAGSLYAAAGLICLYGVHALDANAVITWATWPLAIALLVQLLILLFDRGFIAQLQP